MVFVKANFSLGLDDIDGSEEPRRFLTLPCKSLLAYGGDDGTITCLDACSEQFHVVQRFDDGVRAVAVSDDGKRVAVGFDSGGIELFHYDEFQSDIATRHPFAEIKNSVKDNDLLSQEFSDCHKVSVGGPQYDSPIRDLQFVGGTCSTFYLIIAHESGMSIVDVTSKDSMSTRLLEREIKDAHGQCGIRGVCQSLDSSRIATLSMNGKLCLWNVDLTDPKVPSIAIAQFEAQRCIAKPDVGEIHGADACERSYRPVLYGDMLATPGQLAPLVHHVGQGSRILEVTSSETNRHIEPIIALAFLSGGFLISSGRDCRVVLWKCDEKNFVISPIASASSTSVVTAFQEGAVGDLYAACATGSCMKLDLEQNFVEEEKSSNVDIPINHDSATKGPRTTESDETDHSENSSSSSKVDPDEGNDGGGTKVEIGTRIGLSQSVRHNMVDMGEHLDSEDENEVGDITPSHNLLLRSLGEELPQPPFSVSSTPLDLARRYLCWNHIGSMTILTGSEGQSQRSTVDISFTDSAYKRPVSFTDNLGFIVGSLGEDGAIFASDLQNDDDDLDERNLGGLQMSEETLRAVRKSQRKRNKHDAKPTGSSIFFYRFETLGALRDKDWFLSLPNGERVVGSACGSGWAAVVTSRRYLRLFSSGGNQGQILWLSGDPVTLAGRSRFLIVFCHRACPLVDKTQQLDYVLWDIGSFTVMSQGPLTCLGKGASLSWAGFSSECTPMVMDSDGMLSMLAPCGSGGKNWQWIPVLDTIGLKKSTEDNFWPITVQDGRLVCVPLKGGSTYPDAARRPVTTTLAMRMPLATSTPSRFTILEELSVRSNLALSQKRALDTGVEEEEYIRLCAQVDKVTLKLFAALMDEGKVERALDLVERLHLPKSYELAVRMSEHNSKVAEMIEDAKDRHFYTEEHDSIGDDTYKPLVSTSSSPRAGDEGSQYVTPVSRQTFKKARIF